MTMEDQSIDIKLTPERMYAGISISIGVMISVILFVAGYYLYKTYYPSTDDAYVNAPLINITAKVNGSIKKIYVKNNQFVNKGDMLLELDPADYAPLVEQASLDILMAKQASITADQQMTNAQSNVIKAESNYTYAKQMAVRYTNLFNSKAGSQQTMQKFVNEKNMAKQVLEQAKVVLKQATIQSDMAKSKIGLAKVEMQNAQRTTSFTSLSAPVSGYISALNLQTGQVVMAGQRLFGLVDNSIWWVDANFKESQLSRLKAGQTVKINLDMYNHIYEGKIQSISHASANTFSLLPAQNATGNWVKVLQRFTVRIALQDNSTFPLRVGASATVHAKTV